MTFLILLNIIFHIPIFLKTRLGNVSLTVLRIISVPLFISIPIGFFIYEKNSILHEPLLPTIAIGLSLYVLTSLVHIKELKHLYKNIIKRTPS